MTNYTRPPKKSFLMGVVLLFPVIAVAAEFYVDFDHPNAADNTLTNDGSEDFPWKTINFGIDNASISDTVYVKARNGQEPYREGIPVRFSESESDPEGTSDDPFELVGLADGDGNRPIIDGERAVNGMCDAGDTGHNGIAIANRSYIEIRGFEIRNTCGSGITMVEACNDPLDGDPPAPLDGTCQADKYDFRHTGIVIRNNEIHSIRGPGGSNFAAIRPNACDFCVFQDNILHDVWTVDGVGADVINAFGMSNVQILNNVIADSRQGIQFKRGPGIPSNSLIKGNFIVNIKDAGIFFEISRDRNPGHGEVTVEENVIVGVNNAIRAVVGTTSSKNGPLLVNHNTLYSGRQTLNLAGFSDVTVTNNILVTSGNFNINEQTYLTLSDFLANFTDPTRQASDIAAFDNNLYGLPEGRWALQTNVPLGTDPTLDPITLTNFSDWRAFDATSKVSTQNMTTKDENSAAPEDPRFIGTPFLFNDGNAIGPGPDIFLGVFRVNADPNDFNVEPVSPAIGLAADGSNAGAFKDATVIVGPANRPVRITDLMRVP